ncbi:MAG: hypothetical protein IPJ41_14130 [Phycisphaerales bacterium]|nr:hypothetical protein [Phycisphaerales bacterium]
MKVRLNRVGLASVALVAAWWIPSAASAQLDPSAAVAPSPTRIKRDNLSKMMREMPEVNFEDQRLEDVLQYIKEVTGADLEAVWADDKTPEGLDKDATITLTAKRVSALRLLEMVLEKAAADQGNYSGGNGWQMTDWGSIECGPKELLARRTRLEVYPIQDMLWEIPNYTESPKIDLQSVLQSSQGGGGGQSPFTQQNQQDVPRRSTEERAQDIIDIIEQLVEPESWLTGGGTATIRYFQGNLLVKGPDYLHRELGGYPWWPSAQTSYGVVNGRRYVSLGVETGISTVDGLVNQPVTGVVGGGPGGPPPGGGG